MVLVVEVAVVVVYLSICLSASLKTKLFCKTSLVFELDNIKNAAILRDFLNFWTWQRQKWNTSVRLPHFWSWQHQKRSNSARLPSKMESWMQSWQPCTVLRFFHSACLKYCTCHEKVKPGHTKCCTCHARSSSQNWRSDAQNATALKKSAHGPPNISDDHVSCTAPATENVSLQISSSNVPRLPSLPVSLLFPFYFPIMSLLFPYYFLIMSLLFPHYFLIFSLLFPYFFIILWQSLFFDGGLPTFYALTPKFSACWQLNPKVFKRGHVWEQDTPEFETSKLYSHNHTCSFGASPLFRQTQNTPKPYILSVV